MLANPRAPEVGLPLLGGLRRPQRNTARRHIVHGSKALKRRDRSASGRSYFKRRVRDRPAAALSSLASIVPSLSGSAALKRFSTIARNSFLSSVLSLSGSAAAKSLPLIRPRNSRLSRVPS